MTYIDKSFYELTSHLLSLNKNEIFTNIKNNYLKVPDNIKNGIEDFFKQFNYWGKLDYKNNEFEELEYKAMLGCSNHIINNKPKLLISVYHNHQDIYRIPLLIETLKPGYKFYLRYHGNNIFPTEVTLIAIYEDKNN